MRKIIIFFILFFSFILVSFANFQPIKSLIYLENKETHEIKVFQTKSYTMKKTWEISFIEFIDNTKIGDKTLFNKWFISQVCSYGNSCFNKGVIQTSLFGIEVDNFNNKNGLKNLYENINLKDFNSNDLYFSENFNIFYKTIFWSSFLIYLFFLPLNLFLFYCFGYLIYFLFFKKSNLKPLIIIYLGAFLFYTIYYISLFYFGFSLLNFSTEWFGFMGFFFINGFIKLILLFISKDLIKDHNKNEKFKSDFPRYILYFYSIILFFWLLIGFIGNIFNL